MTLPNFLIVGAVKSGTTSLYNYIRQHPQVCMPELKEPDFFVDEAPRSVKTLEEYQSLFSGCSSAVAVGEASVKYLAAPEAPERIMRLLGKVRIIMVLRNPVDAAYSLWGMMHYEYGQEPLSFSEALQQEDRRMADPEFREKCGNWPGNFFYFNRLKYYGQVRGYIDLFGPDYVRVLLFEDLVKDPVNVCGEVFQFLGIDRGFTPDIEKHNVSASFRFRTLQAFLVRPHPVLEDAYRRMPARLKDLLYTLLQKAYALNRKTVKREPLDRGLREELAARYKDDILELEKLIGRDLSSWY